MKISRDNKFLVSASWDLSLKVFDLAITQQIHHFEDVHLGIIFLEGGITLKEHVNCVALTSDNKFVYSASRDRTIKVSSLQNDKQLHHFTNAHKGKIITAWSVHYIV